MDKQRNTKNGEVGNNVFCRMILDHIAGDLCLNEENVPCNTPRNSVHSAFGGRTVASTSGSFNTDSVSPGEYVRDPGSLLSLQPWIFRRNGSQNYRESVRASGKGKNLVDVLGEGQAVEISPRSPCLGSGPGRGCGALRSRRSRRNLMKPLVPMENSYVPQLYSENFEMEECTFAPAPSPASTRPFVVTDGTRIISKSRYEPVPLPFNIRLDEECRGTSLMPGSMIGIAPLPELKKLKHEARDLHDARLGLSGSQRSSKSHEQAGTYFQHHSSTFATWLEPSNPMLEIISFQNFLLIIYYGSGSNTAFLGNFDTLMYNVVMIGIVSHFMFHISIRSVNAVWSKN
jgi:hypothetical protein